MILVGTSGFSYADWVGPFYPPGLSRNEFVAYYGRHFRACELNFSYYRMPTAPALERMAEKSANAVIFVVKANQAMTHVRKDNDRVFVDFREALKPLRERQVLGGVLAQFPFSFQRTAANIAYVQRLKDWLGDVPVIVEFRHTAWIKQATFSLLKDLGLGFCCVDEPPLKGLLPPLAVATSANGYVRFHGRNREKWWRHDDPAERYDYLYPEEELRAWVPRIKTLERQCERVFVFMNNHRHGQAVVNATQIAALLA
jgi:uncharacterized protein YecE (DUF72 family)